MWWASGNRDEAVFVDPCTFDVTRDAREHMAFGKGGPHLCLGNQLARMEIRIMFEEILARVDSAQALGEPGGSAATSSTASRASRSTSPAGELR